MYYGRMRTMLLCLLSYAAWAAEIKATRAQENPLISVGGPLGDNVNGPSVIRVPDWAQQPLGRYYMYFAHHKGQYIRMAYADSLHGPWKIHEPGVLNVSETAFFRPQPDPDPSPYGVYTHVASPEIYVDQAHKRILMWVHGEWTEGKQWPAAIPEANAWMRQNGYSQYTQVMESTDGLHFTALPPISRQPYLRVFEHGGEFYGIARLGLLMHAPDPRSEFRSGPSAFGPGPYVGRVRHVALLKRGETLHVFLSVIGTAPEKILHTTIALTGDWTTWRASNLYTEVLEPQAEYECPELPTVPSEVGEIDGPAKQLRDPALFEENGKVYLFYTVCGEQGIGLAEVVIP